MWLETEYQDWITRYECNTKAQEEIFKNLSINRLERKQAAKDGKPTKELDKTFTELLAAQNIQPRQTGMDTFADAQTFGTLLQNTKKRDRFQRQIRNSKMWIKSVCILMYFSEDMLQKCLG